MLFSQSILQVDLTFQIFTGAMESSTSLHVLLKLFSNFSVDKFDFLLLLCVDAMAKAL